MDNPESLGNIFLILNILIYWIGKLVAWLINTVFRKYIFTPKYFGLSLVALLTISLYILTEYSLSQINIAISSDNAYELGKLHGYFKAQAVLPGVLIFIVVGVFSLITNYIRNFRSRSPSKRETS